METQTMTKKQEQTEQVEALKGILQVGDTVYTVLRSVSKSGMFRRMDVYAIKDNRPVWLTSRVAKLISCRYGVEDWRKSAGLGVSGCGMDMGFHVVNSLSYAIFGNGNSLKHEWI